jgi:hypothetical protein
MKSSHKHAPTNLSPHPEEKSRIFFDLNNLTILTRIRGQKLVHSFNFLDIVCR